MAIDLKQFILEVKDFPKPGVGFKDITPIVQDAKAFKCVIDEMAAWARKRKPEIIVGIESRGFLFGAALAHELKLGMTIIRKKGKLPRETVSVEAPNEYAVEHFEIHRDALKPGQRALIVDDLIATGSSSTSAINLVGKLGATVVGFAAVVELSFLGGEANIKKAYPDVEVFYLVRY
ncbi:MAG: adenine phosphoribosyltransferase [Candidatus Aminicenantes bacterium]|jgi:adenine phosphoribosyltransferase|nr:adenine phosphoribosyltransferase [Candidatus Aminicenantes bacterium]